MPTDIRNQIATELKQFRFSTLKAAATSLLGSLGYQSEKTLELDNSPQTFLAEFDRTETINHTKALVDDWKSIDLLFQLTDEELSTNDSLFPGEGIEPGLLKSYLFFSLELEGENYARGKLATITRQLNRIFPMPVMVIFKYNNYLSIAVINRRRQKRDEDRDVLGKVTLIHNISISSPHRGHLDILASLSFSELAAGASINSFDALHEAWEEIFNIELLNKRFYRKIQEWFFWAVQEVRFPHGGIDDEDQRNRIAVIRLLTRIIFCWFAREKQLIPTCIFESAAAGQALKNFTSESREDSDYYRAVLQNLFFAVLNTPLDKRKLRRNHSFQGRNEHYMDHSLLRYRDLFQDEESPVKLFEKIPFLNGGLFDCLDYREEKDGKNHEIRVDGFSDAPSKQAFVPNVLFFGHDLTADLSEAYNSAKKKAVRVDGLFTILKSFKFTVTENTPIEEEIALDPELLGRIFENLLAEYNPETQKSARKESGSFYTRRTIVDYMVSESLKAYLENTLVEKIPDRSAEDAAAGMEILFSWSEKEHAFNEKEKRVLLDAIYEVTILDPACGSGAFPMGMLQKLVYVLEKLDHGHEYWKKRILDDTPAAIREETRRLLEQSSLDFQWKLGLVQRCIYGVDIQPIAVQIAKLRCFVSLLVDFQVDESRPDLGVPALPNLEFKFIAADSLIKPPSFIERAQMLSGLEDPFYGRLGKNASDFFFARDPKAKNELRREIEELIEEKIGEQESSIHQKREKLLMGERSFWSGKAGRTQAREIKRNREAIEECEQQISLWESYRNIFAFRNAPVGFFDTRYFFPEIEDGFDLVIGNPPYVQIQKFSKHRKALWEKQEYQTYRATADIYCLFYERGYQLLKSGGHLCYISSNKWMRAEYGENLRKFLSEEVDTRLVLDFGMAQNFGEATTYTCTLLFSRTTPSGEFYGCYATDDRAAIADPGGYFEANAVAMDDLGSDSWVILSPERFRIKQLVEEQGIPLEDWDLNIYRGVLTGLNEAFYLTQEEREALIARESQAEEIIVPLLRGRHIERYSYKWDGTWMINSHNGVKDINLDPINIPRDYPVLFEHLKQYEKELVKRQDKGDHWTNLRNCAYIQDFQKPKIIYQEIAVSMPFLYDDSGFFVDTTCYMMTSETNKLAFLTAVFNSSLFRCSFKNNFPENSGNASRVKKVFFEKIPIKKPTETEAALFDKLVSMIQEAKKENLETETAFLEEILDACVMEIYFPEEVKNKNLQVINQVSSLLDEIFPDSGTPKPKNSEPMKPSVESIRKFCSQADSADYPIREKLDHFESDSPELFGVIKKEGRV